MEHRLIVRSGAAYAAAGQTARGSRGGVWRKFFLPLFRSRKRAALLLAGLLTALSACGVSAPAEDEPLHILATTYPIYLFATAVTEGVEDVEVTLLVNQPTACLHDYTLTVNDMKAIERADVLLLNGGGLEEFLEDALAASPAVVINCSQDIELLPAQGHEGHHHETEYDPHFWMSEEAAAVMLCNIAHGLSALDPDHTTVYTEHMQAAIDRLPDDPLKGAELSCPYLITFHDGFQYFALDNGLTLLKSVEEEEGSTASAAEIKEISALIREYDIPAIFTEKNGSDAAARAIARETGAELYQLDMIMSGQGTGIQPYLDAMKHNTDTILEALG